MSIVLTIGVYFSNIAALATVSLDPEDGSLNVGAENELEIKVVDPPTNAIAVQLRFEITGGSITDFVEDSAFIAGPQCPDDPENTTFTLTELCVDLVGTTNLEDQDVLGTLTIVPNSGQEIVITKTEENLYVLDDATQELDEGDIGLYNVQNSNNGGSGGGSNTNNTNTADGLVTPTPIITQLPQTGIVDDLTENKLTLGMLISFSGMIFFTYIYIFSNSQNEKTS